MVAFSEDVFSPLKPTPENAHPLGRSELSAPRYYTPEMGRWPDRDPDERTPGECPVFDPGPPGPGMRRHGRYQIPRCTYVILAGHGLTLPAEMYVSPEDKGCAFGAAYGCLAGGGEYVNPNPDEDSRVMPPTIVLPPIRSPGLPSPRTRSARWTH